MSLIKSVKLSQIRNGESDGFSRSRIKSEKQVKRESEMLSQIESEMMSQIGS